MGNGFKGGQGRSADDIVSDTTAWMAAMLAAILIGSLFTVLVAAIA